MTMTQNSESSRIDFHSVNTMIAENIELFLDYFSIEYIVYQNRVALSCPMHDSSKPESLNIFTNGDETSGNFVCWTKHCEIEYGKSVFNFIKFLLSKKESRRYNIFETIRFIETICNKKCNTISVSNVEQLKFNNFVKSIQKEQANIKLIATREYVKKTLNIPAQYYINRGYKEETLSEFDVGFCNTKGQPMYMRVVVPIYDITGKYMIGCLGRTINDKCDICEKYHYKNRMCPSTAMEEKWASKWINSSGFKSGDYLYNIWNAEPVVKNTGKVIIVEGPGDVWRMHEAGYKNVVGLFGCRLTDNQFELLEKLGAMDVYLALDNDTAGILAKEKIASKLSMFYNVHDIKISEKDIGDTSVEDIKKIFGGII